MDNLTNFIEEKQSKIYILQHIKLTSYVKEFENGVRRKCPRLFIRNKY